PAITLSSRRRLARASSSIGCRAIRAERRPSTTAWVWDSRSRSSAARDSSVWPPDSRRLLSSATSRALPSARRTRPQASAPTKPTPATRHTRSSANNSSSTDILRIVAPNRGINKPVNMSPMAEIHPLPEPGQAPDRIPLEEVYMRMAEELAKRSTCARLQVGTVIATSDLTQVLGIGYNGNARGLPNRCDATTPGACGCRHSEQNAPIKGGGQLPGKVMYVSAPPVPVEVTRGPFDLAEARRYGLTRYHLRAASWRSLGGGFYAVREISDLPLVRLAAAARRLPNGGVFSGRTAAWLHGLDLAPC